MMIKKILLNALIIVIIALVGWWLASKYLYPSFFRPGETILEVVEELPPDIEIVGNDLDIVWEIAPLPDADLLVTERSGTLRRLGKRTEQFEISDVHHFGEGGLLGLALHPQFEQNRFLYLYLTVRGSAGVSNRVERYRYSEEDGLKDKTTIIENIPGARFHNGGRIAFGPDGYLYIATGDAQEPSLAQDKASLAGKILRISDEGAAHADNPFGSAVYSLGHRNPQGMTWDNQGRLWATEHGPSANDELNLIEAGANYGWPNISGLEQAAGMITPRFTSGSDETWAPAGLAYYNGSLYFGGLRGSALYRVFLEQAEPQIKLYLQSEYGRLRALVVSGSSIYLGTSNRDGRGQLREGDDQIIRINLDALDGISANN